MSRYSTVRYSYIPNISLINDYIFQSDIPYYITSLFFLDNSSLLFPHTPYYSLYPNSLTIHPFPLSLSFFAGPERGSKKCQHCHPSRSWNGEDFLPQPSFRRSRCLLRLCCILSPFCMLPPPSLLYTKSLLYAAFSVSAVY